MGNRNSYKNEKGIRWDLILLGIGVVLLLVYGALQIKTIQDRKAYERMVVRFDELKQITPSEEPQTQDGDSQKPVTVSYQRLFDMNEDMVGWLNVPGTDIDYPVMQTMEDEEYYLYRNFFGEDDRNGTLILDTDSDIGKTSNNLIIHGHNMRSGAMFGRLTDFENEEYAKSHNKILFTTKQEVREYEIVAVFRSRVYNVNDKVFKYYTFFEAQTQEAFDDFYSNIKALSAFDTGVTAEFGDEFITLSTCVYHAPEGRLVVVGRRAGNGESVSETDAE